MLGMRQAVVRMGAALFAVLAYRGTSVHEDLSFVFAQSLSNLGKIEYYVLLIQ